MTTIYTLPSSSSSSTMAATFTLVSQVEGRNKLVVEEEEQEHC